MAPISLKLNQVTSGGGPMGLDKLGHQIFGIQPGTKIVGRSGTIYVVAGDGSITVTDSKDLHQLLSTEGWE
jgi:hypothetical protein